MKFNKGRPFPAPLFRFCVSCRLAKGNSGSWEATDETHGWWTGGPEMSPWNFLWNQSLAFQCLKKKKRGQLPPPQRKANKPFPAIWNDLISLDFRSFWSSVPTGPAEDMVPFSSHGSNAHGIGEMWGCFYWSWVVKEPPVGQLKWWNAWILRQSKQLVWRQH